MARVVVVGLGPAGADLLLPRARAALGATPVRFVRTVRHPAVFELAAQGIAFTGFDRVYDTAPDLDSVYREIADALVIAATKYGEVVYAVPGNPVVAERSVIELRSRAAAGAVELEVVPGLSFADLAWARLGVDPMAGARVLDGRALDVEALESGGAVLFAQVDDAMVCSDLKLALLDRLPPKAPVVVLQRLGLADEHVETVPLVELDRVLVPDHLTAVFVRLPPGAADNYGTLVALARRLRGPGGCPWDAEQTHHSLTRHLLEEAYEVVDAIEAIPPDLGFESPLDPGLWTDLADELGDLLFQVVFHSILAEEEGAFTAADVPWAIHDKLVRRHPHVFGDVEVGSAGDVVRNWEQIKKDERNSESLVDSVPASLPALLYTHKLLRKAASVGLEPGDRDAAVDGLVAALDAVRAGDAGLSAVGEVLAAAVVLARVDDVDAESALRSWAAQYRAHFQRMEAAAREAQVDLHTATADVVAALWAQSEAEPG